MDWRHVANRPLADCRSLNENCQRADCAEKGSDDDEAAGRIPTEDGRTASARSVLAFGSRAFPRTVEVRRATRETALQDLFGFRPGLSIRMT
jgi:hypothetical protein